MPGAQAKLYLTDPLLAWLPRLLRSGLPGPDMTALTEMTLGVALARAIDGLEEGRWLSGDTIGYLRTGVGNEIDFAPVAVSGAGGDIQRTIAIEAKWVDAGWRGEAKVIEARFGNGILATKSLLDTAHKSWAIPAPLVALLLN